jgi:hypothetical protein
VRRRSGLLLHRGALSGLQDVALFARGSSRLTAGAGIVAATSDPAGARRLVAGLRRLVQHEAVGAGVRTSAASIAGAHGFRVLTPRLPGPIDVVASGDRVVAAYGDATTRDALGTGNPLAAAPQYRAAQASLDGAPPAMLLDFAPVAALAAGGNGPAAQRASAYLSALRTLALGWRGRDDRRIGRMVVRLR